MRKDILCLLTGVLLFVGTSGQISADALLRAWVSSDNGAPVRLSLQVPRSGFPTGTIQTVRFTIQNPRPRRVLHLQAIATYTVGDEQQTTTSNPLVLEIDQTARDCRLYLYVINGYALEDTLLLDGLELNLPYNSAFVVVPIGDLPAESSRKGQVKIFAR
ncbi:MAG: hypothetical protein HPY54_15790 [Chthonomonadetes bacterium]|nr:hypothetical protein [Chthonomonadetes bacterium]